MGKSFKMKPKIKIPLNKDEFDELIHLPNIKHCGGLENYQLIFTNSAKPDECWFFEDEDGTYGIEKSEN